MTTAINLDWGERIAVSPGEAADRLGVSRPTIYKLMNAGELPFVKVGTRTLIPVDALHRLVNG